MKIAVTFAVDTDPVTAEGQMFAVNMFLEQAGGHYVMHNLVTEFDEDRTIAWLPGQLDDSGTHSPGGWFWRYDLAPLGPSETEVTLTYDWSAVPQDIREYLEFPPFGPEHLINSLHHLAALAAPAAQATEAR